ncbi:hypothetical protein C8P68_103222 [Mucilaginibacter yixingensis]|uniref:Uncharacterized protein n=1 Tax=Mucilaginibacter yixingensis TaxID=1295612 RepID=A0A2T5JB21_9SPHI|nr:hypothetical protein [Mucilaginibacter yixingensis]PTQ98062.1 hypothetical protein C8P68_103222 [Mucilaginibacter yixingensis]
MITPDDDLLPDDNLPSEADDQQSQKDVHSDGFDDFPPGTGNDTEADRDRLRQAYNSAESAFTLRDEDDDE